MITWFPEKETNEVKILETAHTPMQKVAVMLLTARCQQPLPTSYTTKLSNLEVHINCVYSIRTTQLHTCIMMFVLLTAQI